MYLKMEQNGDYKVTLLTTDFEEKEGNFGSQRVYKISYNGHEMDYYPAGGLWARMEMIKNGQEFTINKHLSDKNQPRYSIELGEVKKQNAPPASNGGNGAPDWDAKDLRMCRCNALSHATQIVLDNSDSYKDPLNATDMIMDIADILVKQFIYGTEKRHDVKPNPSPDPKTKEEDDLPF